MAAPISLGERDSLAVTVAPRAAQKSAVATPVLASPTTKTRLPVSSIETALPQFQRRQREQRKHQRDDPKSHDHLRLAPACQLKVVMDRRHPENALAAQLERADLQNHGKRLDNEDAADEKQKDLLLDDHGD